MPLANLRGAPSIASVAGLFLLAVFILTPPCRASETETADPDRIDQLIDSLGSDRFFVREWAQAELSKTGLDAFDALMEAQFHEDIEVAARARYLLRSLGIPWNSDADHPAVRRIFFDYDTLNEPARAGRIERLALLDEHAALEPLCRLIRFERSEVLSKRAALVALDILSSDESSLSDSSQMVLERLGQSRRTSAGWLTVYLAIRTDAGAEPSRWSELVREEESVWQRWPQQSHQEILVALLRHEAILLERFDLEEEAVAAMRRMIALESGDTETLTALVGWLAERQAWNLVDDTVLRFGPRFENDPLLLYALAAARQRQGQADKGEELAKEAQKLEPNDLSQHVAVARELYARGMLDWAEREFRFVIDSTPVDAGKSINMATDARMSLAYLLHDREDHLAAALLLKEPIDELRKQSKSKSVLPRTHQREKEWKARMHYYYACHWEKLGDRAEQLRRLEAAVGESPFDVDVLISLYRLPSADPKQRPDTLSKIKEAIAYKRQQIERIPSDVRQLNELAWLIANTEGDLDLALRCSQKSLEIQPGSAGLLDTLAYCYFAVGELERAVMYQTKAVERESHSGHMRRQLERFKNALESSPRQRSAEEVSADP